MSAETPKYLYKYRSVDADALAMLASDKVYLSRLDAFNDPYESLNLETESLTQRHRLGCQENLLAASLRVCALSEEHRDLLMWGHYANSHRGFCIRFEFAHDPHIAEMLYPVEYAPKIPVELPVRSDTLEHARQNALVKSDKWVYEREWRIISSVPEEEAATAELFLDYKPAALSGIIFGVRTSGLHKTLIRKLVADHDVEFLQAVKRNDDFALSIEPDDRD